MLPKIETRQDPICGEISSHPSYAVISFCKRHGGSRNLFGSAIEHEETIGLTISSAELHRNSHSDTYYNKDKIIDVEMSHSQFAEAITSFNNGVGVPCTLRYLTGENAIPRPDFVSKQQQFKDEYKSQLDNTISSADDIEKLARDILSKDRLTKADKSQLISYISQLATGTKSNSLFMYDMFIESMEKVTTEAKHEIEAFAQNRLDSIAAQAIKSNQVLLTANTESDTDRKD